MIWSVIHGLYGKECLKSSSKCHANPHILFFISTASYENKICILMNRVIKQLHTRAKTGEEKQREWRVFVCCLENNGERGSRSWTMDLCVYMYSSYCPSCYLFLPPWCCTWGFPEGNSFISFLVFLQNVLFSTSISMSSLFSLNHGSDQWWFYGFLFHNKDTSDFVYACVSIYVYLILFLFTFWFIFIYWGYEKFKFPVIWSDLYEWY